MTLIITATGQRAEVEEVVEAGYYLKVAGHSRFLPAEAVTHPAPSGYPAPSHKPAPSLPKWGRGNCPDCGAQLVQVSDLGAAFIECSQPFCFYLQSV